MHENQRVVMGDETDIVGLRREAHICPSTSGATAGDPPIPDTKTLGLGFARWLFWRNSIPQTTRHYEDLKHLAVNSVVAWRQIPLQSVLAESVYYL